VPHPRRPAGSPDAAKLAQISPSIEKINGTLNQQNVLPALSEIQQAVQKIEAGINAKKPAPPPLLPQDCFDAQFLANSDRDLQALRERAQRLRTQNLRPGKPNTDQYRIIGSHYVYFENNQAALSPDDEDQIRRFLSAGAGSDAALAIRGVADGQGTRSANEKASFVRARAAALFTAQQQSSLPLVDLRWTVASGVSADRPHNRYAVIQILQACK
jgi:hypothetical protein